MSILKILHYPDKRLRKIAQPVYKIDDKIKKIIKDMFDTMSEKEGIGLAATQVNIHLQIIIINKFEKQNNSLILINPKIVDQSNIISMEEGCLSIPNYIFSIPRFNYIKVEAINLNQKKIIIEAESTLSICIQHEIDHLQGKLFIDYLSKLKQERIYKKFKKINKIYN